MAQTPKISILMPVYNVEPYLRAALDSVLGQTLREIELICVDDGSTDGSPAILEEYAARDARITVLRQPENKGLVCARKRGIQAARGQYILFLDSDDELLPDACETVWNEMQRSPVDVLQFGTQVVACGAVSAQERKDVQKRLRPYTKTLRAPKQRGSAALDTDLKPDLIKACYKEYKWSWTIWNKAYSATLCKRAEPYIAEQYINMSEDEYLFFILLYFAQSYRGIAKTLHRYYLGRGMTGGSEAALLRQFHARCARAKIYALLRQFLREQQAESRYAALLEKMQREAAADAVWRWRKNLSRSDAARTYAEMVQSYGVVPVISALADFFWDDEEELLCRIAPVDRPRTGAPRPVKNIAVYNFHYVNGGIERVVSLLMPVFLEMGYRVVFVTDRPPCAEDYALPDGIERVVIPNRDTAIRENYAARAQAWQAIIERYEIDTILYHPWYSMSLMWDACVFKGLHCNVIVESHNSFSLLFLEQWVKRYKLIHATRMADAVVVLSHTFEEFWKNFCPAYYIPNPTTLPPKSACAAPQGQNLLWVGRLSGEKRPEDALRAMQRIVAACPQAQLVMVGAGETEAYAQKLQALVDELGLRENVTLAGYHVDVGPYYRQAAVLLMTSMFEGFPMVLVEAKSYGVPTVMYDLPYLEMVKDARGVVTVSQEDVNALADAAIRLLRDERARSEAARQARAGAEDFAAFDLKAAWQKVFDDVGSGAAAMPQVPTEEQRMVNLWLDHMQQGEGDAPMRRDLERMRTSKFYKMARAYWKCKDMGSTVKRKLRRKLRQKLHR